MRNPVPRELALGRSQWYHRAVGHVLAIFAASMIIAVANASPLRSALPADTTLGIHLAQPYNYREPIVHGRAHGDSGVVDYVWGAVGNPGDVPGATTRYGTYSPWGRDSHDRPLAWFVAHHPTWVMYTADRRTPARLFGDPSPVLDTTNPQVQVWIESQEAAQLASGFDGISWDNGVVYNVGHAVGHYDAVGQWIQLYSSAETDSTYAHAQVAAYAAVTSAINSAYPNATETLNQPFHCDAVWSLPLASTDMILDEEGFTNYGNASTPYVSTAPGDGCSNDWLQRVQEYVRLQKNLGKGLVLLNEEPYPVSSYMTDTNHRARTDLQWALANYLLVKYSHTYFWWGGVQQYGGAPPVEHEYAARVGSPVGDVHPAEGVFMREYTNGLAIVNPDPAHTVTIRLPRGYRNLYGESVASLTMPPHSGNVLIGHPKSGMCRHATGASSTGRGPTWSTARQHPCRSAALRRSHHRRKATARRSRRHTADMGARLAADLSWVLSALEAARSQ